MEPDGDINTVGEYCSMSSYRANKMLDKLAS